MTGVQTCALPISGIATVIIRRTADEYTVVDVNDWVVHDESIHGVKGY